MTFLDHQHNTELGALYSGDCDEKARKIRLILRLEMIS